MGTLGLFLFAALIVGASKGGLSTAAALAVPILSIWMDPLIAAGVLLPVFLVSDVVGVWLYRHEFSRANVLLLIPAGLAGVILATFLAPHVSSVHLALATGLVGLFYCGQAWLKQLRGRNAAVPFRPGPGIFWGVLTGITSFISHTGAPPFQSFVLPQRLPKMQYAGTNTLVFAAINLFKLPAYAAVGLFADVDVPLLLAMALVATLGAVLGRRLAQWMPEAVFTLVIQILLFVVSLYLVGNSLTRMLA
ncbi:MAG: sulfite exporter TauE/SafE family protein [Rhodobacteraceae bacterium]|nr:MAG: sulfite exporter TauE/SafE family protein [Paracoccaceae bacterium]